MVGASDATFQIDRCNCWCSVHNKIPSSQTDQIEPVFQNFFFLLKALMFFGLFAHVSICLDPPTHYVSKSKHLTYPTLFAYVIYEWSLRGF